MNTLYYFTLCTHVYNYVLIYGHTQVYYCTYTFIHPDNDECSLGTDDCTHMCINTIGSFICGCNTGYILDTDGVTCNGMQKLYIAFNHTYKHKYVAGFR